MAICLRPILLRAAAGIIDLTAAVCKDCLCLPAGLSLWDPEKDSEGTVLLEIVPAITPDGNFHDGDFIEGSSGNSPFDSGCVQGLSLFAGGFISMRPW